MNEEARFWAQVGRLKSLPRAGWLRVGLNGTESVADHSFHAAVLALILGELLGVNVDRLLKIMLVHDLPESDPMVGDITPFCGIDRAEKRRRERAALERLCAWLPDGPSLMDLWLDYDEIRSPEADLAHQIDALEMAMQAREYQAEFGTDLSEFVDSARRKIRHPALLRLLDADAMFWQDLPHHTPPPVSDET